MTTRYLTHFLIFLLVLGGGVDILFSVGGQPPPPENFPENSVDSQTVDVRSTLSATHILPLLNEIEMGDNVTLVIIGDHSQKINNTLFSKEGGVNSKNLTETAFMILNSSLSLKPGSMGYWSIKTVELGGGTVIDQELLNIIVSILKDMSGYVVLNLLQLGVSYAGLQQLSSVLYRTNGIFVTPQRQYGENPLLSNVVFVSALRYERAENIFDYAGHVLQRRVIENTLSTYFVPLGREVQNFTVDPLVIATTYMSLGIGVLMSGGVVDSFRLQVATANTSRTIYRSGFDTPLRIPDFYLAYRLSSSSDPLLAYNDPLDSGSSFRDGRSFLIAGSSFFSSLELLYDSEEKSSSLRIYNYTALVDQSMRFEVPEFGFTSLMTIDMNISVPLFAQRMTIEISGTGVESELQISFSMGVIRPRGFIMTNNLNYPWLLHELKASDYAVINWNVPSGGSELIDMWIVGSLEAYVGSMSLINESLGNGGKVLLILNPDEASYWNGNFSSYASVVNITGFLDPSNRQIVGLSSDLVLSEIPIQVTDGQSWINPKSRVLQFTTSRGIVMDLFSSSGESLIDTFPLNGIYSVLFHKKLGSGDLFVLPDDTYLMDYIDGENINLVRDGILAITNVSAVTPPPVVSVSGREIKISVTENKVLGWSPAPVVVVSDGGDFTVKEVYYSNQTLEITLTYSGESNRVHFYLKIPGLPSLSVDATFQTWTVPWDIVAGFTLALGGAVVIAVYVNRGRRTRCRYCTGNFVGERCKYCGRTGI